MVYTIMFVFDHYFGVNDPGIHNLSSQTGQEIMFPKGFIRRWKSDSHVIGSKIVKVSLQ